MKVVDLSRIKSGGFCCFLTEVHFGIGKWENKKLGFTSLSSQASKAHKAEKNLHDWLSGIEGRY